MPGVAPKAVKPSGMPGIDSLTENAWQLEYPDREQVGDILYYSQRRRWLRIDKRGSLTYETIDRQDLVLELDVSYRDVRILDPLVATPYPTALLIREKALVVNMEAVRMIICANRCYVLSVPSDGGQDTTGVFPASNNSFVKDLIGHITRKPQMSFHSRSSSMFDQRLPYELRALEAALQSTNKTLTMDVSDMENRIQPCLRNLVKQISDQELEQMRVLKTTLSGLTDRVAKVRTELEDILDDDQDMLDMYLGKRAQQDRQAAKDNRGSKKANSTLAPSQQRLNSSISKGKPSSWEAGSGHYTQQTVPRSDQGDDSEDDKRTPQPAVHHLLVLLARLSEKKDSGDLTDETLSLEDIAAAGVQAIADEVQPTAHAPPHPRDISECECLLEVYYKQVDELARRLAAIKARIVDTEACIEVLLDQRRNGLTALTLMVNSVMLSFAFVSAVVGGFGMNFATWMSDEDSNTSKRNFWTTLCLAFAIGFGFFVGVMLYARFKRLLFTPDVFT